jgi:hypothetical protein
MGGKNFNLTKPGKALSKRLLHGEQVLEYHFLSPEEAHLCRGKMEEEAG